MDMGRAIRIYRNDGLKGIMHKLANKYRHLIARHAISEVGKIAAKELSSAEKFSQIYRKKLWVKAGAITGEIESLSGHGSSFKSTIVLRKDLEALFLELNPKVVFDAPCGDFNWMRWVRLPVTCSYVGGDIVPAVVESDRRKYGSDTDSAVSRTFHLFDITTDRFPVADVWLCKDCFQHLSVVDIRKSLINFCKSSIDIALLSSHNLITTNTDINTGDFRGVNLTLSPFNLPSPDRVLLDSPVDGESRFIGVWTRQQIATALV